MHEYNGLLTKNEEQKQFMFHVVNEHRQMYANCSKKSPMFVYQIY